MPGPLGHLRLTLLPGVEALPAALAAAGRGQDPHRGRVVRDEAADVVVREAAVAVGSAAAQDAGPVLHAVAVEVGVVAARTCTTISPQYCVVAFRAAALGGKVLIVKS